MPVSQIQQIPIGKLRRNPANTRTHPKKQIAEIARSIREFGFAVPLVADEQFVILAGHARHEAGEKLGCKSVPVVIVSGLSAAKRRAFILADNKLAEKSGYDRHPLAVELNQLAPLLAEEGYDIGLTGFEPAEIDGLLGDLLDPEDDPADEIPTVASQAVSRIGDKWQLGHHRLLCGNATNEADLRGVMGRKCAAMVFTDPPYNVRVSSVQGRGKIRHREFVSGSGEMSRPEYTRFLTSFSN
jgi:ParB-like chromosome segregation protein Spo0J